ncbi:MAG TPA: DUF2206 domain-containing protein [Candidatus Saccharimonadales bacterium]|nr:DUF2206 domain-containing protein [Candidatus Saccharimonadales bacterium]
MRIAKKLTAVFRPGILAALGATGGWMLAMWLLHSTLLRTAISVPFLTLLPGYVAYRALVGYKFKQPKALITGYSLGLSLITLMLTGLGLNQLLLTLGNPRPLTAGNLTLAVGAVTAALITGAAFRRRPDSAVAEPIDWRQTGRRILRAIPSLLPAILLPFLAVGGAITLNNGGGNYLAMAAMGGVAAYFMTLAWKRHTTGKWNAVGLYSICLALLLGTSMRGWNITGHDIMQEYQVFQLTLQHAAWHMSYYQDAYNACMSITILPTMFQQLTGLPPQYVFKFVYQLLFAGIAPIMYTTIKPYVSRKTALLAVFTFLAFPTFLTDITMLNRQEIALLCFALSMQAGLDKHLGRREKTVLGLIFLIGMILSHYSTSYVAVGMLVLSLLTSIVYILILNKFFKRPGPKRKFGTSIYRPIVTIGALLTIFAWNTLATHTSNNIAKTLDGVVTSVPHLLQHVGTSTASPASVVSGKTNNTTINKYVAQTVQRRVLPANQYYPTQTLAQAPTTELQPLVTGSALRSVSPSVLLRFFNYVRQAYAVLIEVLIVFGVMLFMLRRLRSKLPTQYMMLGLGGLLIVVLQVALPAGVVDYGLLRVIQQSLLVLALPIVLSCQWLLTKLRVSINWRPRLVAVALTVFFLLLSGFVPTLTGGFRPVLALSNSGFYYEAYYTHQDEISADQWLVANSPKGSRVYADEFARRKLIAYSNSTIFAQSVLTPAGIPVDSYVYLSYGNTTFNEVPVYYGPDLIYHDVPYKFLTTNKNLLYSSGSVLIYK